MKRQFLYSVLLICAVMLSVSTVFATGGTSAPEEAAIRITEQRFADHKCSFRADLTAAEIRGSVFIAVYTQSGQMKYIEDHTAAETLPVTLNGVLDTDSVKIMWTNENYMPLACSEVDKTLEITAANQDEFADAVLDMIRSYEDFNSEVSAQWDEINDEYAFARLIVRSDDTLPDLSAYHVARRISDAEGHTVLQFASPDDARTCAEYLKDYVSSDGYITPDTLENILEEADDASGNNSADSTHLSWGVPVIHADSYAANLLKRNINRSIKVAVIDTGVDYTHEFLRNRTVSGYDFVNNDDDPMDEHYHGTHVAGTIVDCTPGLTNLKVMPVRVLGASGSGTSLNVGLGIRYAADNGANVINMSLGGSHNSYKDEAIHYAISKNVVVVVAAGNSGGDTENFCPAHVRNCITVSAVDENLKPANFSNCGDAADLAAPGVNIKSCVPKNGYRSLNGTSMASPHVAACAAMLLEESDSLTPAQVEKTLVETVQVPDGWDKNYGAGIVNMESSAAGFYALLYTDGEMVFQNNDTPAQGRTLSHKPYPVSATAGGNGEYAAWYDQRDNIERVTFAEEVAPSSTALWFYGCKNLKFIRNLQNLNTKNVTNMSQMFARCTALETLDLRNMDTGNVTNMRQMFFQCGSLRTILVSDSFSVAKVTDDSDMFTDSVSLVGSAGTKYSGSHTDKTYARIDEAPSRPGYFTGEQAEFYAILYADGEMVFQNSATPAPGRTPLHDAFPISAVSAQYADWYPLRDKITKVTFAEEVHPASTALWFYGFENLKTIQNPENLKTGGATNMSQMFARCTALETLDLRNMDTGNVTNMRQMFFQCSSLRIILVSDLFDVSKVTDSVDMFTDCVSLTGENGTAYSSSHTDKTYARLDGGSSSPGYFSASGGFVPTPTPSETIYAVLYSNGELKFQSDPNAESGKAYTKIYTTDSGGYDRDAHDVWPAWHEERTQIRSVNFGTAVYPTSTALWFYGCENLASITNPGNLHTDYVTDMSQMFAYCSSLTTLDLSGFNTEKTVDTSMMFYRCENLGTIYTSGLFTTTKINDSILMFSECSALKGGNGTVYSGDHVDKTYARIDSVSTPGYFTAK